MEHTAAPARAVPPDVLVVGDLMVDVLVEAGALARGGDVHGEVRVRPGGAGANAAVWAAWRGARVGLIGRVGADLAGGLIAGALRERGVRQRVARDPEARTGAMLVVRERGERSMVADRGANARLSPADLPGRLRAGAVLVSGYLLFDRGSEAAALAALDRAEAPLVAVDAASWPLVRRYGPRRFLRAVARATVLLANEREASVLVPGVADPRRVAARLGARFDLAVVKRGERGAVASVRGEVGSWPSPRVQEADPTGAGDAFDGVLLAELARGAPVEEAVLEACRAGALAASSPEAWPRP